jgi:hypothetical protein
MIVGGAENFHMEAGSTEPRSPASLETTSRNVMMKPPLKRAKTPAAACIATMRVSSPTQAKVRSTHFSAVTEERPWI